MLALRTRVARLTRALSAGFLALQTMTSSDKIIRMTMNQELKPGQRIRFSSGKEARVVANHAASRRPGSYMMRLTVLDDGASEATDTYVVADGDADIV